MPHEPTHVDVPHDVQVSVKQQPEDLTGVPKLDATIKIIKYLGFPIAAAIFGLYVVFLVVGDYRDSVKASTLAQSVTSLAVVKQSDDMEDIKRSSESNNQAMLKLREGQIDQLEIQRGVLAGITRLVELQSDKK